jgi:hypothetical protein
MIRHNGLTAHTFFATRRSRAIRAEEAPTPAAGVGAAGLVKCGADMSHMCHSLPLTTARTAKAGLGARNQSAASEANTGFVASVRMRDFGVANNQSGRDAFCLSRRNFGASGAANKRTGDLL